MTKDLKISYFLSHIVLIVQKNLNRNGYITTLQATSLFQPCIAIHL